jgi:hypothetical protein
MRISQFLFFGALWLFAAPLHAETVDVYDDHGGSVVAYNQRWAGLAQRGVSVRIVGPCQSACTVLLGHIPRSRICVTPDASFGFHLAKRQLGTDIMRSAYPADIKGWIRKNGGLTTEFIWLRAPDIFHYFRRCR